MPKITDEIRQAMDKAEEITDRIVEPAYAVLTDAERAALIEGLLAVKTALAA